MQTPGSGCFPSLVAVPVSSTPGTRDKGKGGRGKQQQEGAPWVGALHPGITRAQAPCVFARAQPPRQDPRCRHLQGLLLYGAEGEATPRFWHCQLISTGATD